MKKLAVLFIFLPLISFAKLSPEWEEIKTPCSGILTSCPKLYRTFISTGWLNSSNSSPSSISIDQRLTFIPDPNHEWVMNEVMDLA